MIMLKDYIYPYRTKPYISIAIPSSIISESPDPREKVRKIGYIGRASAIFRVEEIFIYMDDNEENLNYVYELLLYLEIPPYLRRKFVPYKPSLRYAGLLPPLKTPHHVWREILNINLREGIVIDSNDIRTIIDIGLDKKGVIYGRYIPRGSRVTVKIVKEQRNTYIVDIVDKNEIDIYWGYTVYRFKSMKEMFNYSIKNNYIVIGASKKGQSLYCLESEIREILNKDKKIVIVFGGPRLDIDEIALGEGIDIHEYSKYIINFIPRQGVESVRTEEAIFAVLSIINYLKEQNIKCEKQK